MLKRENVQIAFRHLEQRLRALGLPAAHLTMGSQSAGTGYWLDWDHQEGKRTALGRTPDCAAAKLSGMTDMLQVMDEVAATAIEHPETILPKGLCPIRTDHHQHEVNSRTLGRFWCHADQSKREPWASQQKQNAETPR